MNTKNIPATISALTLAAILTGCSTTAASSRSASPNALEPAIISKFLRARADAIDKSTALNAPVDSILNEARLDCKAKGFDVDKDGKGVVNLDPQTGLLFCVKTVKPPAPPQSATPEVKK